MKKELRILFFVTILVSVLFTLKAEIDFNKGVYSYPNTNKMLCFDSDSTFLYGYRGSGHFVVYKYRQEKDSIKAKEWLSCSCKNENIKVDFNFDTISIKTFLKEAKNDTIVAESIYIFYKPDEVRYKIIDDKTLTKYSEIYKREEQIVCTNAGIEDFYHNISHFFGSPYYWMTNGPGSIPSVATREALKHIGNKFTLYYMHEELLYSAKYFCNKSAKNHQKYNSFDKVKLKRKKRICFLNGSS